MSESDPTTMSMSNPFSAMMSMQRRSIEQTRRAMQEGMELNKQMSKMMMESMDAGQSMTQQGSDFTRSAMEAYFEAMESSMPGNRMTFDNVQTVIDDQFEAFDEVSMQTWKALEAGFEDNAEAYEEFVDRFASMMDESFEAYTESIDEFERMSNEAVQIDVEGEAHDDDAEHGEA